MTANDVVRALEKWMSIRGQVGMIMSDNASYFHSKIVKKWCIRNNVQQGFCPPYYHVGIGIIEQFQRTLEDRIRRLLLDRGGSWVDHIQVVVEGINSSWHNGVNAIPSQLWIATNEERAKALDWIVYKYKLVDRRCTWPLERLFVGDFVLVFDAINFLHEKINLSLGEKDLCN